MSDHKPLWREDPEPDGRPKLHRKSEFSLVQIAFIFKVYFVILSAESVWLQQVIKRSTLTLCSAMQWSNDNPLQSFRLFFATNSDNPSNSRKFRQFLAAVQIFTTNAFQNEVLHSECEQQLFTQFTFQPIHSLQVSQFSSRFSQFCCTSHP